MAQAPLPAELRIEVLKHYLNLTNGVHSDRFPTIKKTHVDLLVSLPSIAEVVPEALYSNNKLTVVPKSVADAGDPDFTCLAPWQCHKTLIRYPQACQTYYIRRLEFHFWVNKRGCDVHNSEVLQSKWLRKPADGKLGFRTPPPSRASRQNPVVSKGFGSSPYLVNVACAMPCSAVALAYKRGE